MKTPQAVSKSVLASMYGVSVDTIGGLLNQTYYTQLLAVGYEKKMKILSPLIVRKFIELYGEPITDKDYEVLE